MPKDIKPKPYSPPLVYDIGGPNLNVVGTTGTMCAGGGTKLARDCVPGASGLTNECETGAGVASSCSDGNGEANDKTCGDGLTVLNSCFKGTSAAVLCSAGSGGPA